MQPSLPSTKASTNKDSCDPAILTHPKTAYPAEPVILSRVDVVFNTHIKEEADDEQLLSSVPSTTFSPYSTGNGTSKQHAKLVTQRFRSEEGRNGHSGSDEDEADQTESSIDEIDALSYQEHVSAFTTMPNEFEHQLLQSAIQNTSQPRKAVSRKLKSTQTEARYLQVSGRHRKRRWVERD